MEFSTDFISHLWFQSLLFRVDVFGLEFNDDNYDFIQNSAPIKLRCTILFQVIRKGKKREDSVVNLIYSSKFQKSFMILGILLRMQEDTLRDYNYYCHFAEAFFPALHSFALSSFKNCFKLKLID